METKVDITKLPPGTLAPAEDAAPAHPGGWAGRYGSVRTIFFAGQENPMLSMEKFPIDFDKLEKGQTIGYAELQQIVGPQPSLGAEKLAFLRLKGQIERKRPDLPAIRIVQDGAEHRMKMIILFDWEAAEYQHRRCSLGARQIHRSMQREARVDIAKLTTEQKQIHEAHLKRDVCIYLALRRAQHTKMIPGDNMPTHIGRRLEGPQREDALKRIEAEAAQGGSS